MAVRFTCIVTNSSEERGAYAIRSDTDEQVYIPHAIADALEIEEFEEVECIAVQNDRPNTPWRAIKVRRPGEPAPEPRPRRVVEPVTPMSSGMSSGPADE